VVLLVGWQSIFTVEAFVVAAGFVDRVLNLLVVKNVTREKGLKFIELPLVVVFVCLVPVSLDVEEAREAVVFVHGLVGGRLSDIEQIASVDG